MNPYHTVKAQLDFIGATMTDFHYYFHGTVSSPGPQAGYVVAWTYKGWHKTAIINLRGDIIDPLVCIDTFWQHTIPSLAIAYHKYLTGAA